MLGSKAHIRTYTGKEINLFEFKPADIDILDIAHALSCINRFNGHVKRPISVAQHSVTVANLCQGTGYEKQALLHDAAEAYIGDMTKWLKHSPAMKAFRDLEDSIQKMIFQKFGCPVKMGEPVELADRIMVRFEGLMGFGKDFVIDNPKYPALTGAELQKIGRWTYWSQESARSMFMTRFNAFQRNGSISVPSVVTETVR